MSVVRREHQSGTSLHCGQAYDALGEFAQQTIPERSHGRGEDTLPEQAIDGGPRRRRPSCRAPEAVGLSSGPVRRVDTVSQACERF